MACAKTLIMFVVGLSFALPLEGYLLLKNGEGPSCATSDRQYCIYPGGEFFDTEEKLRRMQLETCEVTSTSENLLMVQRFATKFASTGSKGSCMLWCTGGTTKWEEKCSWEKCKGCSDCTDVCPQWCDEDTLSWAPCEACTASPTASPTTFPPTPAPPTKTCSTFSGDVNGHHFDVGGKFSNVTAADCKDRCERTAECTCYAFDPSRSNTCWLKASPCGSRETWEESGDMTSGVCQE